MKACSKGKKFLKEGGVINSSYLKSLILKRRESGEIIPGVMLRNQPAGWQVYNCTFCLPELHEVNGGDWNLS